MLICPAVHIPTRSLLRSSSTPEPSDPLYSIVFQQQRQLALRVRARISKSRYRRLTSPHEESNRRKHERSAELIKRLVIPSKRGQRGTVPKSVPPLRAQSGSEKPRGLSSPAPKAAFDRSADKPRVRGFRPKPMKAMAQSPEWGVFEKPRVFKSRANR